MSTFLVLLILVVAVVLVWRFVSSVFHPRQPGEPVDDPFSLVLAPRRRGPKGKSGAVALEEPGDDDDLEDAFPPRSQ
jgi:hypothetical protein